ncbi:3-hydroxybutyryl-CoA dehydrogenase [Candidatus Syntrophocurvum alkaliphilum]|uniref:3-hydroxybutyryl-CoA dehydrogenase n=1 Tax=Candidatus Syntrophocurvum alkaliphilum TaxID=2293317 RepID=A0A6I6DG22_9FIRM|nr:3-hydroxyacyl-CoA dehydrogenase NAD-binding domain-containing protein [Candidatus Syntrophocurvum alkaliphilum]QGT99323.1 3-hydroxybutyryl-CoA dehydrogenase [Candidatus Syntrophocurvum alkaliphilum]
MHKIAVLGAGFMGAGIAQVAAQGGYNVIIRDIQKSLVEDGINTIKQELDYLIEKEQLTQSEKEKVLARIKGTTDLAELSDADIVIEAVVENIAIKKQLFAELDNICPEHTILATNTSTLSITEIASVTKRIDKVIGMHFFYPVPRIKLVELIKGLETSDETIKIAQSFVRDINKEHVLLKRESPGFIVNRILIPYLNEAIFVYGDGIAEKEDIDSALKAGAGMPKGPLEISDMMGLDTLYSITMVLYNEFKDTKYRPHPLFSSMVRAGYYGEKTGKGFYEYD